ncbi:unnamed protein product [Eruca vesicaria subsp. sativa]|uniref:Uncharacterized protein n=1 Tax=Eruca vesicaria subsp. sativa TaxID=29727 RepID=A0ABC8KM93_ERUVS|nr:unnamed protein product [Eruca vesicaria subsp. sativa]
MKKPGGTEKKRYLLENKSVITKQGVSKDAFQLFAEKVRDNKGLESRWAVMEEARVEYVRGKYFVSFLKNPLECKEILEEDKDLDAEDIANVLLEKNVFVRCDRVTKTARPGKKKLSTWPAHIEIYTKIKVFSETDAFLAWTFEKRHPLWQTLLSFWLISWDRELEYYDLHSELIQYRRAQMIKQKFISEELIVDSHLRRDNGLSPLMPEQEEVRHQIHKTAMLMEATKERWHLWRKIGILQRRHEMSNTKRSMRA